jgi:hypothetical protein
MGGPSSWTTDQPTEPTLGFKRRRLTDDSSATSNARDS